MPVYYIFVSKENFVNRSFIPATRRVSTIFKRQQTDSKSSRYKKTSEHINQFIDIITSEFGILFPNQAWACSHKLVPNERC